MSQSFRLPGFAALPKRPAHIKVTKDGAEVDSVAVADKALLFGRKVNHAPKLGTYRLDHDSISREHAAVVHSFDGSWFIMDVGSRFGTHVNGERLEAKKYVPLAEGAQIKFGESTRSFTFSLRAPAAAAPPPRAASPPPARKKAAAPPPPPPPKPKSSGGPAGIDDDLVDPMANYVDRADDDDDDDDDDEGEEGGRGEAGTRRGKEGRPSKEERREQKRREKERRKAVKKELKKEAKRAEKKEKKGKKEKKEKKEKRDKEAKRPKRDREEAEGGDGAAEQPAGAEEAPTPPRAGEGRAAGSDSDSDSGRSDGSVDDAREAADEARRKRAREASAADWNSSRRL